MKDTLGVIVPLIGDDTNLQPLLGHRTIGTLPFGGRYRLIDFSLSNMVNSGIVKVGVIGTVRYSSLIDHLGTGKEWLLSRKTNDLSILTGSVNRKIEGDYKINMLDFILNKPFFENTTKNKIVIAASNIVTTFDLNLPMEVFEKNDADVVLVYRPDSASATTLDTDVFLTTEGHRVSELTYATDKRTDKKYADMMIIAKDTLLKLIKTGQKSEEYDMMRILMDNLDTLKVYGYELEGYFNRVFDINHYYQANMDLLDYDVLKELFLTEAPVYTKIKDNHPTRYGEKSHIEDCIVGSGGFIDGEISHSIAFREVEIEEGSKIKNSIMMQKCHIGKNVTLDHVIFDKEVTVRDNTSLIGTVEEPIILSKATNI